MAMVLGTPDEFAGGGPMISVILPYYNRSDSLGEAMDSVLAQTFRDFRLILIDDGSTDESRRIATSYDDHRIVHVLRDSNEGVCVARNLGLDVASDTPFIAYMDSDDFWLPQKLAVQLDSLIDVQRRDPRVAVLGCGWRLEGAPRVSRAFKRGPFDWRDVLMGRVSGIGTPMLLVDRARTGPRARFDPSFPALVDRDYVLSCIGESRLVCIVPEELAIVRRGRDDHVANPENAGRAWESYLRKYGEEIDEVPGGRSFFHFRAAREFLINRKYRQAWPHVRPALREQLWGRACHLIMGGIFGTRGFAVASRLVGDISADSSPS